MVLRLNEGWALHSLTPRQGPLTGGYWDAFATLPLLTGRPDGRLAVLGNAGGTVGNIYAGLWPRTAIDGVEIDPLVSDVGRRYMGMTQPAPLRSHRRRARSGSRARDDRFDAIVVNAYRQPYIPFHLATREFFRARAGAPSPRRGRRDQHRNTARSRPRWSTASPRRCGPSSPRSSRPGSTRFNSVVIGFTDATDAAAAAGRLDGRPVRSRAPARRLAQTLQVGDARAGAAHRRPRADRVAHRPGAAGLPARGRPGLLRRRGAQYGDWCLGAGEAPRAGGGGARPPPREPKTIIVTPMPSAISPPTSSRSPAAAGS